MSTSSELVLVKLGGSLLTDKRAVDAPRHEVISRLAGEIAAARPAMAGGLIVGHGSGSFGHVAAAAAGLQEGLRPASGPPRPLAGVSRTQERAGALHRIVVTALAAAGLAPFSLPPSASLVARAGRPARYGLGPLYVALDTGLLPVVYGDVVMDSAWGASICSTERVLLALVSRLRRRGYRIRRMLWLGETAGVYDADGALIPHIHPGQLHRMQKMIDAPAGTDVTGGMLHRLQATCALARRGIESWIADGLRPGILASGLRGEEIPGTRISLLAEG